LGFIEDYGNKIIIPSIELKNYIGRNYQTIDEFNYKSEKRARQTAQLFTALLAIGTIILMLYDNMDERRFNRESQNSVNKVEIMNPFTLPETLKIKIPDSVKVNDLRSVDTVMILNQPSHYILKFEGQKDSQKALQLRSQ